MGDELLEHAAAERLRQEAPLARRVAPRTLDDLVGQDHILGKGKILRRAIEADRLRRENETLRRRAGGEVHFVGSSSEAVGVRAQLDRVAPTGSRVLITGASSGIGKAAAVKVADAGATALLVARSVEKLEETKEEIERAGGVAHIHRCDMSDIEDVERMVEAAEALYGPYRWGRYDILVLPPSFPFGGMENPRLTFATPTILAGDRSLVSLVAHELAHSWSGNLVTNASWRDLWLNEGFTTYFENRIIEALYGPERAEMEATLDWIGLRESMAEMSEDEQVLNRDLSGHDPEQAFNSIPYDKGRLLLD